jgi:lauroyl/myristoyl acyltransferase
MQVSFSMSRMSEDRQRRLADLQPPDAHLLQVKPQGLMDRVPRLADLHRAVPLAWAVRLARLRSWLTWRLSRRMRLRALEQAEWLSEPGASGAEVTALAREYLGERFVQRAYGWHPTATVPVRGLEHLERARWEGRGVLVASFHFGLMWNLGYAVARHIRPLYISGGRRLDEPILQGGRDLWLKAQNMWIEEAGCRFVHRGRSYELLRGLLERGEVCGIGWDVPGRTPVRVQVLGRTVEIGGGLARLAMETGSPVVPAFVWRDGNRPVAVLFPAIDPREVAGEAEINARVAAAYEAALAPRLAQAHFPPWKRRDPAGLERWAGIRTAPRDASEISR